MKKPHAPSIRKVLRSKPDGMTLAQIHALLPEISKPNTLRKVLDERMPDVYIDRWEKGQRGQWQAVWMAVNVPKHCPYPTDRFKPETRWIKIVENNCAAP